MRRKTGRTAWQSHFSWRYIALITLSMGISSMDMSRILRPLLAEIPVKGRKGVVEDNLAVVDHDDPARKTLLAQVVRGENERDTLPGGVFFQAVGLSDFSLKEPSFEEAVKLIYRS